MKRTKIFVSFLLILSLLLPVIPGSAEEAKETVAEASSPVAEELTVAAPAEPTEATILHEEESLRGKYEKHFLMSDGTYQAVVYNEPIHYETDSGWVEVDNTLTLQTAADGTAQYATADGVTDVTFSRSFDEQLVTMRQGNYSLAWGVQAVSNAVTPILSTAEAELVTADLNTFTAEEQKTMAAKSSSTIQYRNALAQDVDLEYIVLPSRVKENIILNSAQNITGYVVTVYTENITARLLENREIEFVNADGEVIFTMTSPYMYDSAGELSEDIEVELIDRGDVCYIFMTPNANWLNDASRVYPITIDPQVTTSSDAQNIIDNYVMENSGVQTYTLDRLYIGKKNGNRTRSYIKFSVMPTIPSDSVITSAQMTLWLTTGQSTGSTASAYMVTGGDWASKTISWANMPAANTQLQSNISHNSLTKYTFSCLTAVKHWYTSMPNGKYQNYGIMVRYYNEGVNDYNPVYSADYTTASKRPSLTITYQAPSNTVSVLEGSTYTLNAQTVSGTITWSSDNTSIATVNASGKVTGVKAGKAIISASVGGVVQLTFTVYVVIPNGVYSIKNNSVSLYLGTGGLIADDTRTQMLSQSASGMNQIRQLWKITYMSNGYYTIRPMHKLDMAAGLSGSNVVIRQTSTTDDTSAVPSTLWWTISKDTNGYNLKYYGSNGLVMRVADGASSPGLGVIVGPYTSTNTKYQWTLTKLSSPPSGAYLYDTSTDGAVNYPTKYVVKGQSKTLSDYNLLPISYSRLNNIQSFTWDVEDDDSHYLTVDENTGKVTGKSAGTATIIGAGTGGSVRISIVVLPFADGTYYLKNRHTGTYATLFSSTLCAGDTITHTPLTTSTTQKWVLDCLDDGTYYIKPKVSSSVTYYLGVATSTADIILTTTPTRWRIEKTSLGAFKFILNAQPSEAIALPYIENDVSTDTGVLLQLLTYSNDSNLRDEWLVYSQAPSYHATVNNYYDFGYPAHYEETPSEGAVHINTYMQAVANRYMELFGLEIIAPGAEYLPSDIDECKEHVSRENLDTLCTHDEHHTELSTLQAEIESKKIGNRTTTSVFWSGHKITSDLYGDNRSISWLYYVLLLERSSQEDRDQNSASVLMHELNHQFGAIDHYHDPAILGDDSTCTNKPFCSTCGTNKRPISCIMSESRMDISDDNVLCDACKQEILAHLEEHHKS